MGYSRQTSSAFAIRGLCVIWAPLVSGLLIVAAFFLDPDIGASARACEVVCHLAATEDQSPNETGGVVGSVLGGP
jgi:hypothetical protein